MICVSLGHLNASEISEAASNYEFVEFRLDLLKDCFEDIKEIVSKGKKSIISCGGDDESEIKYLKLTELLGHSPEYIDIDFELDEKYKNRLIEKAVKKDTKIILSYHDYKKTPGDVELLDIFENISNFNPDIIKICCMMNSINDIFRISDLYDSNAVSEFGNEKLIAFTMGEYSFQSRMLSLLNRAPFVYVSNDDNNSTALGQPIAENFIVAGEMINRIQKRDIK